MSDATAAVTQDQPMTAAPPSDGGKPVATPSAGKAPRVVPSPRERDAAMRKANTSAKTQFTEKFEGAHIRMPTVLHNRAVTREFTRTFHIAVRNWYIGTTVPRTALGDSALANQVEAGMLKKIKDTTEWFKNEILKCDVVAKDADVDFNLIGHTVLYKEETKIIGPVAMALHGMYKQADKYIDVKHALYAFGQVSGDEASNSIWEVKKRLQGLAASLRNYRRLALETVNERGKSREGFKAVATNEGDESAADSNVTKLHTAGEESDASPKLKTA